MSSSDRARERQTLDGFCLEKFRGITDVDLQDLGRFNLLVGSGNSGKTSILEALAVFCSPLNIVSWLNTARSRESRSGFSFYDPNSNLEYLSWLFPHSSVAPESGQTPGCIRLLARGSTPILSLNACATPIKGTFTQTHNVEDDDGEAHEIEEIVEDAGLSFEIDCEIADGSATLFETVQKQKVKTEFWRHAGAATRSALRNQPRIPFEFLAPYSHRNQPGQLRGLSQAVIDNEKASINNLIRDLDPNIENLEIISDKEGSRPLIVLRHRLTGLAPLSVFGDGLRRALTIALAIQQARNGLLLIDEIEAALHISALDRVFPWIMRACQEFNVQLFATTHSLEAVDAISRAGDLNYSSSLVAFHLSANVTKRYNASMLRRIVRERGLDIR